MYHSEHGQDRWLEENVFKGKRNGVFVEFGALDGLDSSNTLFFERERDWSGVLIEANPRSFCSLLGAARPRSVRVLGAVGLDYGIAEFMDVDVSGWSGIASEMDDRHRERIRQGGGGARTFLVPTLPLSAVLQHCGLRRIDYLSVDIEGAELAALSTIDFDHYEIGVVDVENNYNDPSVEGLMRAKGYKKIHAIEINDIYQRSG